MIPCATCGADPIGTFERDGSPRYDPRTCLHPPIQPGDPVHPRRVASFGPTAPSTIVELPADVAALATREAEAMEAYHAAKKTKHKYDGEKRNLGLATRARSRKAEYAVSIFTGLPVSKVITSGRMRRQPDVGRCIEARCRAQAHHRLIAHREDPSDSIYVLVHDLGDERYRLVGWASYAEAIQPGNLKVPPEVPFEAFFVPHEQLHPTWDLLRSDKLRARIGLPPISEGGS